MKVTSERPFCALALGVVFLLTPLLSYAQIKLEANTEVNVVFQQDISSKYLAPGEEVPIRLVESISVGGVVLVKAGASGRARVKSVESAGKGGKPGRITVELVELEPDAYKALDNKTVLLEAVDGPITAEGKGKKTLSYLFILGLFIKGGEAVIPPDKPFRAKIKEDVFLFPADS